MIDRPARSLLAAQLRHLAAGVATNDSFEDRLPENSADLAVHEVIDEAWFLYDDLHVHRLTGRYRLSRDEKRQVARWILFLTTDLEYEWPPRNSVGLSLLNVLTLGLLGRVLRAHWSTLGNFSVWPFIRAEDLDAALQRPPYLLSPDH